MNVIADLTWNENRCLERLFRMGGGYVLDFSNRRFDEFVIDWAGAPHLRRQVRPGDRIQSFSTAPNLARLQSA